MVKILASASLILNTLSLLTEGDEEHSKRVDRYFFNVSTKAEHIASFNHSTPSSECFSHSPYRFLHFSSVRLLRWKQMFVVNIHLSLNQIFFLKIRYLILQLKISGSIVCPSGKEAKAVNILLYKNSKIDIPYKNTFQFEAKYS